MLTYTIVVVKWLLGKGRRLKWLFLTAQQVWKGPKSPRKMYVSAWKERPDNVEPHSWEKNCKLHHQWTSSNTYWGEHEKFIKFLCMNVHFWPLGKVYVLKELKLKGPLNDFQCLQMHFTVFIQRVELTKVEPQSHDSTWSVPTRKNAAESFES